MAVIGYEPAPNGVGYQFQRDDGPPAYLFGPEADALKAHLDATAPPDARLAQHPLGFSAPTDPASYGLAPGGVNAPPGPMPSVSDVGPSMVQQRLTAPVALQGGQEAPQHTSAPAGNAAPLTAPQLAREAYSQPISADQLPVIGGEAAQPDEEAGIKSLYRAAVMKEALRGKYVPGRAGVDPETLRNTGVPVEVQETVSGGIPETPQEKADRLQRQEGIREEVAIAHAEQQATAAERIQFAEETRANAANAAINADVERHDAEKQLVAAKQAADSKWAEVQRENEAAAGLRVDPNRLFHGKNGAAVAIGSALAAGLGAFGASLGRGQNYAQQIIQSSIDRDISSQADEIQRKGAAARNAVADFARTYGLSLEEAKLGVKSAQYRYVAALAEQRGARTSVLDEKQKASALAIQNMKESESLAMEMRNLYEGKVQKHFQVIQPQRGSAGYYTGATAESLGKGAATLATTQKAFPETAKKNEGEIVPNLTRAATAVETGLRALPELQQLSEKAGVTGQVVDKITGLGADTDLTVAAQHMAYSVASAEVNGMVPEAGRVKELEHAFASKNPITRDRNIKMGADILRKKKQSIESVSAKTAKIGTIAGGGYGGGEGGAEE